MIRPILSCIFALFVSAAVAQIGPGGTSGGGAATSYQNTAGLGVGVWGIATTAAGTGYVPGEVYTPTLAGATTNSILGGAYVGATFYVATTQVVSATVAAGGASCTNGTQTVTGTTGTGGSGAFFTASVTVSGNAITAVNSIISGGDYRVNPTLLTAEPVTGASCSGSQLNIVMGVHYANVQNPGSYSAVPSQTLAATQSASSGSGSGATFTVTFAPLAAVLLPPINSANFGAQNTNQAAYNFCSGYKCLNAVTTALEATSFGWNTLAATTTGSYLAAFGVNAGGSNTTGSNNAFFGRDAGRNNTTGSLNTFLGDAAGASATTVTGSNNVGVGSQALNNINSGSSNTTVGYNAGAGAGAANFNTYIGSITGQLGTGGQNVGIGQSVFDNASFSGAFNVGLGRLVGHILTSGAHDTLLGYSVASATLTTGARDVLIGTDGNCDTPASGTNDFFAICASSGATQWLTGSLVAGALTGTLNFVPTFANAPAVTAGTNGAVCASSTGVIGLNTANCIVSFRAAKTDIRPLNDGLAFVMNAKPVYYRYTDEFLGPQATNPDARGSQPGFIAEDIASEDRRYAIVRDGKPSGVRYEQMTAALVSAIQAQQKEINALKRELRRHH